MDFDIISDFDILISNLNHMPNLIKKILLSTLAFLVIFLSFAPGLLAVRAAEPASAGTWYNQDFGSWFGKVYDTSNPSEIFGERYTAAQVQWVVYGLFAFILNSTSNADVLSCIFKNAADIKACTDVISKLSEAKPANANLASMKSTDDDKSLTQLIFADRPLSGIAYTKNVLKKFSLVPEVNAQSTPGFGFSALEMVQGMWTASRNMAYGLFVLVAIVFSFMIMFRVKISPQLVISVQSSLPKLITSLILVTFSYAIAGFLIDLMYVVYGLISVIGVSFIPFFTVTPTALFGFLTGGKLGLVGHGINTGILGMLALYMVTFVNGFIIVLFFTLGLINAAILGVITAAIIASPLATWLVIIGALLAIILVIILIWNTVKIIFALLKAFVNILLLTIFAPLQIVMGNLIPSLEFGNWIKSYFSNLAVFVVTSVLLLFAYVFMLQGIAIGVISIFGNGSNIWLSAIVNLIFGTAGVAHWSNFADTGVWPPLLMSGQGTMGLLMMGASFVMFTLIPKATEIVAGLISGKPFAYGTAIGEAFGPLAGVPGMAGKQIGGAVSTYAGGTVAGGLANALGQTSYSDNRAVKNLITFLNNYADESFRGHSGTTGPGERRK